MLGGFTVVLITIVAAAIAAIAQYIFKKNVKVFEFNMKEVFAILTHKKILIGIGLYAVSLVIYLYALRNTPVISFVYPIFSSTFVFIFLISRHALKESFSNNRTIGILLIIIGIIVISFTLPA